VTAPLEIGTEAVAVAWVKALATEAGSAVATTVPEAKTWPLIGTSRAFLQVMGTGGGTVGDTPYHRDVVSVDSWATKDNSDRPPLGLASQLLLRVWGATFDPAHRGLVVVGPDQVVSVDSVRPLGAHPRRIPDQDTSRAHYSLDVEISWTTQEGS
jgi:hypothetical protein